jgi:hypothetical protein
MYFFLWLFDCQSSFILSKGGGVYVICIAFILDSNIWNGNLFVGCHLSPFFLLFFFSSFLLLFFFFFFFFFFFGFYGFLIYFFFFFGFEGI